MNRSTIFFSLGLAATMALSGAARAEGEHEMKGHAHDLAMRHGGQVTMTKEHHFETLFSNDGIRVFFYTDEQAPMMVKKASGKATLKYKDGQSVEVDLVRSEPAEKEPAVYFCPMHSDVVQDEPGVCTKCGGMKLFVQDFLYAKADLSKVEPGSMKAIFSIDGLKGDEKSVTFTESFAAAAPMEEHMEGMMEHEGHGH